jgi:glycosyltransferase involved in cell wall biosynthesis
MPQRLRNILLLHSSSDLYGASRILLHTIAVLRSQGFRTLVCLPEEGPLADEVRCSGGDVRIMALGILRRKYFNPWGLLGRLYVLLLATLRLAGLIRRERVTLVYSNTTGVLVGVMAARITRTPHLWHVHEIIASPRPFARFLAWALKSLSDKTVAVSTPVKEHWDNLYPEGSEKIVVIHNGLDAGRYRRANPCKLRDELGLSHAHVLIGMIGRVHYWKGQDYFLRIAGELATKHPQARFVMVGDAFPGYEYLYERNDAIMAALDLGGRVFDLRYRHDVPDILAGLDIFVLPSVLPDPLPTVVLEAMAASKPVVATAHGGALEMVVDGETGFHVPWDNPTRAAEILESLITRPDWRATMGDKGHQRLTRTFSPEAYSDRIARAVNDTANGK